MISILSLWAPILLSAVLVFVASSILHMVLTYHRKDYKQLPDEAKTLSALRGVAPGYYFFPYCSSTKEMNSPEMQEKYKQGPVGQLTVMPPGPPTLPKHLAFWFLYCVVVSIFAAYVATQTLAAGVDYLEVFQVVGTVAFVAYGLGEIPNSIWRGAPWGNTFRAVFDGAVYCLLTAGCFGWLWPGAN